MPNASKMSKDICKVEEFMQGPLVTWFFNCLKSLDKESCTYEELVGGVLINHVFLQMGVESVDDAVSTNLDEPRQRTRNLRAVLANLQHFYEERGDVVLRVPQVARLGREPLLHVVDAELLLCLLLGVAVQCPNNEDFIEHIKSLDVSTQQAIAEFIKQVVHVPNIVLSADMLSGPSKELESEALTALENVRRVYRERNRYLEQLRVLAGEDSLDEDSEEELQEAVERLTTRSRDAELVDCRAQVRRQRDELKKALEELHECREELRQCKESEAKLQKQNELLVLQAQSAELYRDELDAVAERAAKADKLEQEIERYKEKLTSAEYLKGQLTEFQEMNQLLMENNSNLEEKLATYETKISTVRDLKKQLTKLQQRKDELEQENERAVKRQRELTTEMAELKSLLKLSTKEALDTGFSIEPEEPPAFINSSLSEQLSNSAQSRALKLELENHRLSSLVDSLKESSVRCNDSKLVELEKENRRLSACVDSMRSEMVCPPRPPEPEPPRTAADIAREKQRRLSVARTLAQLRCQVDRLQEEKLAAVERARSLERLLEEKRDSLTVRRSAHSQEHAQLREDFGLLFREHERALKRLGQLSKELAVKSSRVVECDSEIKQLRLYCADLASERRYLLEHSGQLALQNRCLFEQIMDYYAEDRKIRDEMNNLSRNKEKLEEKIMDQYRRMPSTAGKKRSIGTNLVKTLSKMRRASSGLFNRSRRSWAEESSERSNDFDYVRGHESDGAGEPRNRKSVDFLDGFRPSDFSFQLNLEERSRKSLDFMEMPCAEEPEKTDEDDLDKTLPAEPKLEEDHCSFAKNKLIDLSLENLLEEREHEVPDKEDGVLKALLKNNNLQKSRSRKSLWVEQGCV